jgi:KRAB domain-containing zinc finger protein
MESGTLPGSMDCYEDMFKEITRKLYGTEDGLTSSTSSANNSAPSSSTPPVSTTNSHPATSMASESRGSGQRYDPDSAAPFVKSEEVGSTLTAFGLAALMQTGFQPAVAAMHSSGYHHNSQGHYPTISPHHLPTSASSSNSQVQPPVPSHHHSLHHQPHLVPPINIPPPPQPTITENPPGHVDRWICSDDELHWTRSKIATYNPAQRIFKCSECDFAGFLSRVAEHWIGTHANLRVYQCPQCPYTSAWARCVRMHIARQHGGGEATEGEGENASSTTNPEVGANNDESNYNSNNASSTSPIPSSLWKENAVLEEVTKYLQRLKTKAENIPNKPQEFSSSNSSRERGPSTADKRYCCNYCPYATDRRDLFTRHENIHRDEKPFQCYVCRKQFNRADHVKKHFLRMHRDHPYDINKIRRSPPKNASGMSFYQKYTSSTSVTSTSVTTTTSNTNNQPGPSRNPTLHHSQLPPPPPPPHFQQPPHHLHAPHHLQPPQHHLLQPLQSTHYGLPLRTPQPAKFQLPKPNGSTSKSHKKKPQSSMAPNVGPPKEQKEKRYTCCYCSWSGVDNWCLKRHLNTHIKPFVCALCDYKAARSERLATHVLKVHNKRTCNKCSFLADDQMSLTEHIHEHQ